MNPVMKLSPADKATLMSVMFHTWLQCCQHHKLNKSEAIRSLVDFQVTAGCSRKLAADRVLSHFRQNADEDEIIDVYQILRDQGN